MGLAAGEESGVTMLVVMSRSPAELADIADAVLG
jgi:hypothetical protein